MSTRYGAQLPTKSVVLPYTDSYGSKAVELYNESGNTAQEWQAIQLNNILATNEDGLWVHSKYGYAVPRRNGKGEILIMRELYGVHIGEHILHTAHLASTSSAAAYRLAKCLDNMGYEEVIRAKKNEVYDKHYVFHKQFGLERITLLGESGGEVRFRTRTSRGGLGEGFDLLIIDEAQEYQDDQESSLKYVVSDSSNPQTIFTGTPPTAVSAGTKFVKYRKDIMNGELEDAGWAEWSVDAQTDPKDIEAWYRCNPSLGVVLTERKIKAEIGDDVVDFNIQRLGLWYENSLQSAISENEWNAIKVDNPALKNNRLFVGIKFAKDSSSVSMAIAIKTKDNKVFTELIDSRAMREGIGWVLDWLEQAQSVVKVAIDGASGQTMLTEAMKYAKLKKPVLPSVHEIIHANAMWEQAICGETVCHSGQSALSDVVTHCKKRAIGSNGGFGYDALTDELDISMMDACMLAHWLCAEDKEVIQKVR